MRIRTWSAALIALALVGSSCSENGIVAPTAVPVGVKLNSVSAPSLGISQVYGGGGNSGATFKNDFIELFNPGSQPVSVAGWSVQYSSAAGTSWAVTPLSGTVQPGKYYLVQESQGTGGTTGLPTPDASGTIAMSATAGKVSLVATTSALSGLCPTGVVDQVSFGTTASNCGAKTTATLTNSTAALRGEQGCTYTSDLSADFATGAPNPRNSASPAHVCPGALPLGPLDHMQIGGPTTVTVGSTIQLSGTPQDVNNQTVPTASVTWSSIDPSIATVDETGKVTGVVASPTSVGITATAVDNGISPKSATVQITVAQAQINFIDVSSSSTSFPAGFQTQLFATARVSSGGTIVPATFTFEAVDPQIATIATVQNTGIVTGVAAPADGTTKPGFRITATPIGGGTPYSFVAHTISIETPNSASTSIYAKNDEFGDPTSAGASNPNDLLIVRPQYTISYNESRGTPNWVSYELDSRQVVAGQDRCNCFTADPLLPLDKQILTSDYTNGGFDRGHMARSFDRTAANGDNARTFYLSNIVPQMADLNQGVWASFENALGDSATKGGRAVYIITGPLYSRSHSLSFVKNEGKVAIPDSTWKVALIGPRNGGVPFTHGSIQEWEDVAGVTVLAVNMPNIAGVRNDPWQKYLTTIDKIESSTGFDFLSLLPEAFQDALEAGDHAPVAQFGVSGTLDEGASITFDASTSTDPDLGNTDLGRTEALSYRWQFSDGDRTSGKVVAKSFANDGTYTVTLVVTDVFGWQQTTSRTVVVANVAPAIGSFAGATLLRGETYTANGSFTDPGADSWTGTVNFGDGPATPSIDLTDKSFALAHTYASAGSFLVLVSVNDGEVTSTRSATVLVKSAAQGIGDLDATLSTVTVNQGEANSLEAKLQAAAKQLAKDNTTPAENILGAFINELQAMMQSGRISEAVGSPIVAYTQRVIASIVAP
ncbi:MAG: trimeric autotransporter adhesin [Gemmatimonadaceae bacterium]|nr:trimeric autotransporter adhesin [Gemmatimonadaceae bacterium]